MRRSGLALSIWHHSERPNVSFPFHFGAFARHSCYHSYFSMSSRPEGIDFTLENSPTAKEYLIETMPGSVALFNYNDNGLLDIFLVNGGKLENRCSRGRVVRPRQPKISESALPPEQG